MAHNEKTLNNQVKYEKVIKNTRKFYENWQMLDANSAIAIVELGKEQQIDIYHTLQIPNIKDFPVEDFFRLPCCSLIANSTLW